MGTRISLVLTILVVCLFCINFSPGQGTCWAEEPAQPEAETAQTEDQAPADPEAPIIEYSRDPDTVVIMIAGEHGGHAADWDPTPMLRIYGDGRVAVKGRNREVLSGPHLSEQEMSALLLSLAEKGVMDFDEEAVNRELDRIDEARGLPPERRYSARAPRVMIDGAPIIIEINLDGYKPIGANQLTQRPFTKRIRRFIIESTAKGYPDVKAVTGLAAAYLELRAIVQETISNRYKRRE